MATMSLLGLYNYDPSIFDKMELPEGVDKQTLIYIILDRSADFETIYPDPDYIRGIVGVISKKWERTFQKWTDALEIDYDPLYNFDRHEEWSEDSDSSESSSGDGSSSNKVTTYDSNTYQPDGSSESHQAASSKGSDKTSHTGHLYGNIGVTTSQQMLEAELDINYWNLYSHISDVYIRELCIPVY